MLAAVVRRSVQALGAAALTQARCSSRVLLNLPPLPRPTPARGVPLSVAAAVAPSSSGAGLHAPSVSARPFSAQPALEPTFASAPVLSYPKPAFASAVADALFDAEVCDDVKSEEEWHRLIDEWAAEQIEEEPELREQLCEVVEMAKQGTRKLMQVKAGKGCTHVCYAGAHRLPDNLQVEPRGETTEEQLASERAKPGGDEMRRVPTEVLRMPAPVARKAFPCDEDHAIAFAYGDAYFAKQVEGRLQQCVRDLFGLVYAQHTLFKECGEPRGDDSDTTSVHVVSMIFSDESLPRMAFTAAVDALFRGAPVAAVQQIVNMLEALPQPWAFMLGRTLRAKFELAERQRAKRQRAKRQRAKQQRAKQQRAKQQRAKQPAKQRRQKVATA